MELLQLAAATYAVRARHAGTTTTITTDLTRAVLPDAFSALPDAPVVPEREPRAPRTRLALATALHRLADEVAPRRPAGHLTHRGYAAGC